jgi:branched-chain amino acid transport system substrate-binding protein
MFPVPMTPIRSESTRAFNQRPTYHRIVHRPRSVTTALAAMTCVVMGLGGAPTVVASPDVPSSRDVTALTLGTTLPDTGSLAAYGPATQAAVRLAVEDANAAGGVLGVNVVLRPGDSGSAGGRTFARTLAAMPQAQAVIGPLSSALVLDNLDAVAGRTLISPATTSAQLSGVLARTVPAEPLNGAMLATLAKQRGALRLVVVGPRDQRPLIDSARDRAGDLGLESAEVVFSARQSASNIATRIVRTSADAMLLASGAETTAILRELLPRGMPGLVLLTPGAVDGVDAKSLRRGTLDGALALALDLSVPRALASRIKALAPEAKQTAYSPQSYDAAAIAILAAEASGRMLGKVTPEGVRAALPAVTSVGTPCDTLARCLRLVRRGVDIDYMGYAGPYALDAAGDPGAARYLVRVYGTNNVPGSSARPVRYP